MLLTYSCSNNENSITQSDEKYLAKTSEVFSHDTTKKNLPYTKGGCMLIAITEFEEMLGNYVEPIPGMDPSTNENHIIVARRFENYLSTSPKGNKYINYYYAISKYGIKNNLVNNYYKEHYELMAKSREIAYDLQHGNNNYRILIDKSVYNDFKEMLELYRTHPNHTEIDPVLDYLEADLEKYYNKPKNTIARDFQ